MKTESISKWTDKSFIDKKERDLIRMGYTRVSPHKKLKPRQYWRDENNMDENLNPCPTTYSIDWYVGEK